MRPFQEDGTFHPIATGKELRRSAVRGAGAAITGSLGNFVVGFGSVVILARLLTPSDFGVVTMVTTFSLLLRSFGLNGFTELIMQREEITDSLASNLFWINAGIGAMLTVIFAGSGRLLAYFFHDHSIIKITYGMSLTIVIGCMGHVHMGLLQRAMRFRTTATINFVGQVLYCVVCVVLAIANWHYWALVWGSVVQTAALTIGAWLTCRWVPSWPRRIAGTASAFNFAMNVYAHYAFCYLTRNTDNLLVGWRFGARALGFYKKAYDLFVLPQSQLLAPVNAVAVGTLSRVHRNREEFQGYLLQAISVLAFFGMAVGADLALTGSDVFRFLFGPGWEEAGRIFALFGPGIGISLVYYPHAWIHLSIGRPERWFRWGVAEFAFTATLFLLALRWGPSGIAFSWTASYFLLLLPGYWYAGEPIGLGVWPVFSVIWRFFLASVGGGIGTALIVKAIPYLQTISGGIGSLVRMVSTSVIFLGLYLVAVIAIHRGLGPINDAVGLLRDLLPERAGKRTLPVEGEEPVNSGYGREV